MRVRSEWPDWRQWLRSSDWLGAQGAVRRQLRVGLPAAFWRPSRPPVRVVVQHVWVARVVWAHLPVPLHLRGRMRRPVLTGLFRRARLRKWGPRGWVRRLVVVQGSRAHHSSSRPCVPQSLARHGGAQPRPRLDRPRNRCRSHDSTVGWILEFRRWQLPRVPRCLVPQHRQLPPRRLRPPQAQEPRRLRRTLRRTGFGRLLGGCFSPSSLVRPRA
jgi:hypothetical protein